MFVDVTVQKVQVPQMIGAHRFVSLIVDIRAADLGRHVPVLV